jgi:hypothetical protein
LDVSFSRLSNWICRRQWVPPEPRQLYRLTGNKSLYRIDKVVQFLSDIQPERQANDYLTSVCLEPDGRPIWELVRLLEGLNLFRHAWRPRDQALYLAGLKS